MAKNMAKKVVKKKEKKSSKKKTESSSNFKTEISALKTAMKNEIVSRKLYLASEKKAKTKISKETFAYLAAQEFLHLEKLKRVNEKLTKKLDLNIEKELKSNLANTKRLFSSSIKILKKELNKEHDFNTYVVAMNIEREGYKFYKSTATKTKNKKLKKFFLYLMQEEASHFEYLQNTYEFLKHPNQWNSENEKWSFEG